MGETSDMMLDGTLCEGCGVYLGATDMDCPCLCSDCAKDRRAAGHTVVKVGKVWVDSGTAASSAAKVKFPTIKVKCPTCARMVKAAGLTDHNRALHGAGSRT